MKFFKSLILLAFALTTLTVAAPTGVDADHGPEYHSDGTHKDKHDDHPVGKYGGHPGEKYGVYPRGEYDSQPKGEYNNQPGEVYVTRPGESKYDVYPGGKHGRYNVGGKYDDQAMGGYVSRPGGYSPVPRDVVGEGVDYGHPKPHQEHQDKGPYGQYPRAAKRAFCKRSSYHKPGVGGYHGHDESHPVKGYQPRDDYDAVRYPAYSGRYGDHNDGHPENQYGNHPGSKYNGGPEGYHPTPRGVAEPGVKDGYHKPQNDPSHSDYEGQGGHH